MLDGKSPTTGPRDMPVDPRDHCGLRGRLNVFKQLTDKLRAARVQVIIHWFRKERQSRQLGMLQEKLMVNPSFPLA